MKEPMRMLTLSELMCVDPIARPRWVRAAATLATAGLRAWGARVRLAGPMPVCERPVIYAANHTHAVDFLPLRWFLYGRGQQLVTWIKPRAYLDRVSAALFARTGNIPVPSRGYVIAADAQRIWGRRPDEAEYRALREHVDRGVPLPAGPHFAALAVLPRNVLGVQVDAGERGRHGTYGDAVHAVFARLMTETLRLSRRAVAHGHHLHIYPQGTVSDRLTPARAGAVQAAIALGLPIVPVGVSGVPRAFGRWRGGDIALRFGRPIAPPRITGFRAFDIESERRHGAALADAAAGLTDAMNALLDEPHRRAREAAPTARASLARFL